MENLRRGTSQVQTPLSKQLHINSTVRNISPITEQTDSRAKSFYQKSCIKCKNVSLL